LVSSISKGIERSFSRKYRLIVICVEIACDHNSAFGLLKKVYARRAKIRGEPLSATANIIPWE
jgi:hypothetical protein